MSALIPVVAYLRVSTDSQAERGYGLSVQRDVIETFARQQGFKVVETYVDAGVSGTTPLGEREGLSAALEAAKRVPGTCLLVARFDRLARDAMVALMIEREFENAGSRVLCADGMNGAEDSVRLLRTMLHGFAEYEKRQLVTRLTAARHAKKAGGGYAGGRPPFGYEARNGALHPHPAEAEVVKWIFNECANEGHSQRRIADALQRERTLDRNWRRSDVDRILKRRDYTRGPVGSRIIDGKVYTRAQLALASRKRG